uniref:Uncharacterized protein n=1 Tax=Cynoglossus semilaevis TaxID=244447 RepID=A0A3P8V8Y8_CYNSE
MITYTVVNSSLCYAIYCINAYQLDPGLHTRYSSFRPPHTDSPGHDEVCFVPQYQQILANNVQESVTKLKLRQGWTLQQDNNPKHCSNFTKCCFKTKGGNEKIQSNTKTAEHTSSSFSFGFVPFSGVATANH